MTPGGTEGFFVCLYIPLSSLDLLNNTFTVLGDNLHMKKNIYIQSWRLRESDLNALYHFIHILEDTDLINYATHFNYMLHFSCMNPFCFIVSSIRIASWQAPVTTQWRLLCDQSWVVVFLSSLKLFHCLMSQTIQLIMIFFNLLSDMAYSFE